MNRKLLALAIGAALSLPLGAQAAPTVYGLLNLSVDRVDFESTAQEETQLNSNASRLGVKGEEALGNGLSAVYKAEWAVSGDVTGSNDLTGRDRFLGLKSDSFGTIKLGAYDTPFKASQGTVDVFNDMTHLDMGNFISGENRLNNMIGYESPKIADVLSINVAVQSGEETGNGDDDASSVSVVFQSGGIYAAVAMDNDVLEDTFYNPLGAAPAPSLEPFARDAIRLTGIWSNDTLQVGLLLQTSEYNDDKAAGQASGFVVVPPFGPVAIDGLALDEQSALLSVALTAGKNVFKGEVVMAELESEATVLGATGSSDVETSGFALGMDHNFTQNTKAFVQVGLVQMDVGGTEVEDNVVSAGMQTKF
jgi:predicted porin